MIDPNQMQQWIRKRIPNAKCPVCETPFWSEGNPQSNVVLRDAFVGLQAIEELPSEWIPQNRGPIAVDLTCANCGYIMLFDLQKIENKDF